MTKITASICMEYQQLKKFCLAKIEKIEYQKTAKRFCLSPNVVFKWNKGLMPKSKRICKARNLDMEVLKEDMNKYRDLYQYEKAKKFKVS